ncbi:hypothetical protein DFH09DRAFT_1357821 [Mycena vulgaris]|nr:hypothetical protein DFH09DRAFT_1357821 [Mycena vulgaris]
MSSPTPHPPGPFDFPLDLERHIFEITAISRPVCIPTLLRVALRVKEWTEPQLYCTLLVESTTISELPSCSIEALDMISRTKSALFVRNLLVGKPVGTCTLSAFTGVENLWTADDLPDVPINMSPLKYLHCHWSQGITRPPFFGITHLELFTVDLQEAQKVLANFPQLTHFALNGTPALRICAEILRMSSLRALVILKTWAGELYPELGTLADEARLVILHLPDYRVDWWSGVLTGRDYWVRADTFIARRISGEIDRREFTVPDE